MKQLKQWHILIGIIFAAFACGNKTTIFSWVGITATNINAITHQVLADNAIKANEYAIRLDFDIAAVGSKNSSGGAIGKAELFNDTLDSLEITSLSDFNNTLTRGKILNQFFLVRTEAEDKFPLTTTTFIRTRKREVRDKLEFLLTQAPQQETSIRFIIKLNLNFGRTLRDTTDAIVLRK